MELQQLEDCSQMYPMERVAHYHDSKINYVDLGDPKDTLGVISNGSCLAMATIDLIKGMGGHPTNFMDCNQGFDENMNHFLAALDLFESDARVKSIVLNCFGGNNNGRG